MACFSCNENKSRTQVSTLQDYKDVFDTTGRGFIFFQKKNSSNLQIMTTNDFIKFKKINAQAFKKKQYEFSHISEFRIVANTPILVNSTDR